MSTVLEPTTLDQVIERATPEQRRYLVERLLAKDLDDYGGLPVLVSNSKGEIEGYYTPRFHSLATEPPKFSAEHRTELDRRLASLDDTVRFSDMKARLGLSEVRLPKKLQSPVSVIINGRSIVLLTFLPLCRSYRNEYGGYTN